MKICNKCHTSKPREAFYLMKGKAYKTHWDCRDSQCIECRKQTSNERTQGLKRQAVEYLGGSCKDCGLKTSIVSVYDFHHLEATTKDFTIGKAVKNFEIMQKELDKCVLLCANCHRIRHATK